MANRKCRERRSGLRHNATRDSVEGREKNEAGKEDQGPFFSLFEDEEDEGINQTRGNKKKKLGSKNGEETSLERRQKSCLSSHDSSEDKNCVQGRAIEYVISVYQSEEVEEDDCEKGKPIRMKEGSNKDGRAKPHEEGVPNWTMTPCELSSSMCMHPKCTYYNKIYCIVGLIYCGEKSQVYKCMNVLNKKTYAMKVIVREERDDHHMNKFMQKYLFLKQNRHRNVIPIYDVFDKDNYYFIVMEYCEGCTLLDYFMSLVPGSLEIHEIKYIMKNLLLGLDFLHSNNIIHRDIKLENIMFKRKRKRDYECEEFGSCALRGVQRSGTGVGSADGRYKSGRKGQKNISLLRFQKNEGTRCSTFRELTKNYITKKRRKKERNNSYSDLCLIDMDMMERVMSSKFSPNRRSEVICGTAPYMSPESLDGIISTANDVWACGVILYALMDGRFPFQISNDMPVPLKKKILIHTKLNFDPFIWHDHPDVLDLCLKLLDPNPFTRIQNAREALIHYCFADMV
ncbi:calcium-dependent protein kinase 4 [Plasmodium cynomolgi strain B]|uniref:Calcium-dependent protein kinase 4 n=1 Tax=Plasmodium cynomolgi (strain B) TaxID=1120755 RepID=K6UQ77_PLACD|nr:calcium-dependent protein kinase 4 [Plasmodium cynomolgi strain B]GAB64954.1 calcium-dependent protein kinase 4 [Plasmodium cynomolgi strain B]